MSGDDLGDPRVREADTTTDLSDGHLGLGRAKDGLVTRNPGLAKIVGRCLQAVRRAHWAVTLLDTPPDREIRSPVRKLTG